MFFNFNGWNLIIFYLHSNVKAAPQLKDCVTAQGGHQCGSLIFTVKPCAAIATCQCFTK